ncbi:TIGR00252 family protein [Methylophaga frappieri]|uniref:UPF0102 protein Q7C_881 n=1 Tax=Methylophaga frappieri (strain ATCC BAA-2434 / DSM 25690 / JAM7) TaxID=754477 RepID=I1YGK7_METFJ|nr:YraN family protein [Methylophaga frappieri]AFJ02050.1 TIGR00252 family protein [Methylophaga frappieri]
MTQRRKGLQAEQLACAYLEAQGLRLLSKNYYSRRGEIDLIMQEANTIVFIEVKARHESQYGSALETITIQKQSRIIATAQHYIQQHQIQNPCRFDAVAIRFFRENTVEKAVVSDWIRDAFQVN